MGTAAGGLGGVRREWIRARRAIFFSSLPVCFYCYHGFYRKGMSMEAGKVLDSLLLVLLAKAEKESTPRREPTRAAGEPTPRMPLGPHRRLESSMDTSPRSHSS